MKLTEADMHAAGIERVKREQAEMFAELHNRHLWFGETIYTVLAEAWLAGFEDGKREEK